MKYSQIFLYLAIFGLLMSCIATERGITRDEFNEFNNIRTIETGWVEYSEETTWNPLFGFIRFVGYKRGKQKKIFIEITLIKHQVKAILAKPVEILTSNSRLISVKNKEVHLFGLGRGSAGGYVGNSMPGVYLSLEITERELIAIRDYGIKKIRMMTENGFIYSPSLDARQVTYIQNNAGFLLEAIRSNQLPQIAK